MYQKYVQVFYCTRLLYFTKIRVLRQDFKLHNMNITTSLDRKTSKKLEFYVKLFENIYAVEKLSSIFRFYLDLTKIQKTF